MKTLSEHNRERAEQYEAATQMGGPILNGIACPKCNQELFDSYPMLTLTSNPPRKDINCIGCGFRGYRIA